MAGRGDQVHAEALQVVERVEQREEFALAGVARAGIEVAQLQRAAKQPPNLGPQRLAQHAHLTLGLVRSGFEPGGQRHGRPAGLAAELQRTDQRFPHAVGSSVTPYLSVHA